MKFTGNNLERLTKKITQEIVDNQDRVNPYICGGYILDEEELENVIRKALDKA
jgi:hypothetical protein